MERKGDNQKETQQERTQKNGETNRKINTSSNTYYEETKGRTEKYSLEPRNKTKAKD